ncbi:MAG: taurine catabolism dioxygenase TauD, partial [Rubrivivax sp.]|nr:taurine catabolism dioxygenase TauD [Rubrivivax sp.]
MTAVARAPSATGNPFDLADDEAYRRWRDAKLAAHPRDVGERVVDVADPFALTPR